MCATKSRRDDFARDEFLFCTEILISTVERCVPRMQIFHTNRFTFRKRWALIRTKRNNKKKMQVVREIGLLAFRSALNWVVGMHRQTIHCGDVLTLLREVGSDYECFRRFTLVPAAQRPTISARLPPQVANLLVMVWRVPNFLSFVSYLGSSFNHIAANLPKWSRALLRPIERPATVGKSVSSLQCTTLDGAPTTMMTTSKASWVWRWSIRVFGLVLVTFPARKHSFQRYVLSDLLK